jgi:glycosyltransferase involved in cell wall biosynthesis
MFFGAEHLANWLFVLPWDIHFVGGVNHVVRALAEQTRLNGGKPHLLVQSWRYKKPDYSEEEIPSVHLRIREPGAGLADILKYFLVLPKIIYTLRHIVRIYDIDVVNIHYPLAASIAFVFMRRLGLFKGKVIISLHGTDVRSALGLTGVARMTWKFMLRGADHVIVVSESLQKTAALLYSGRNISVVRNGVDFLLAEKIKHQSVHPLPSQRSYILTAGSFEPIKGYDILLYAFSGIADDCPEIDLVIIGRSGSSKSQIEALVATLGLQQRVTLLYDMAHEKVLLYMKHADLFVLPSRNESMPLCILEAGALGIPVVATDVGGVKEIILDESLGLLVRPEDPKALGHALAAMLGDENRRISLSVNLQNYVKSMFSWEDAYRRYLELSL